MKILNEDKFSAVIKNIFELKKVSCTAIDNQNRKNATLKQELFFDLSRKHYMHKPDFCLTMENIPCEVKSPKELYYACRYSRAHLYSYLLQTIYGQCYSYADLFRQNDDCLSIFLILPKIVRSDLLLFSDIENLFNDVLTQDWKSYKRQMELNSIQFESPNFVEDNKRKYGIIGGSNPILATKIKYFPIKYKKETA